MLSAEGSRNFSPRLESRPGLAGWNREVAAEAVVIIYSDRDGQEFNVVVVFVVEAVQRGRRGTICRPYPGLMQQPREAVKGAHDRSRVVLVGHEAEELDGPFLCVERMLL